MTVPVGRPHVDDGGPAPRTAAFLVLDRTLISGSSLSLLFRDLRDRDVYSIGEALTLTARHVAEVFFGGREQQSARLRRETIAAITGRRSADLEDWSRRLATQEVLPRVYPDVARIIATHRAAGDLVYLVTASPIELARPVAAALELDGALGTRAETDGNGYFTGRLPDGLMHGPVSLAAVRVLAAEQGIGLERSHAYSDSYDDRDLLAAVGHPHAVNPEPRLLEGAVRRGWAVHELRPARRQLLVGVPPVVPVGGLISCGVAIGLSLGRRRRQ